jgi:hypothetical protein
MHAERSLTWKHLALFGILGAVSWVVILIIVALLAWLIPG